MSETTNRTAIICVDDEEIILSSLEKQLKRGIGSGYEIELVSDSDEAIALCAELTVEGVEIALVICDQIMPGMSGDELLVVLHFYYPQTLKILLTGQADADAVGNVVNASALYRYIAKPWDETDFILTVKEALRRFGQEKQLAEQNLLLQKNNKKLQHTNRLLTQTNQKLTTTNGKLGKSLDLLLATLETADDGILVLDNRGDVVIFNQQFISLWNIPPNSMDRDIDHISEMMSRRSKQSFSWDLLKQQTRSQKYHLLKLINGKILESYSQVHRLKGKVVGRAWGFRDVTTREREKAAAKQKSRQDTLTQLPKRRIITCQLKEAIAKAQQNTAQLAVMFVDLDRFKVVNDTLGHQAGDRLLQQVVTRLKNCIRGEDIIARWGNDEFTLLLPQIDDRQHTTAIATRVLEVFNNPFILNNKSLHVTVSIGIAVYPEHGKNADILLKNADLALSQAQQSSRHNYQYYDPSFSSDAHQLLTIENLLHSALENNELTLYYQPIVNVGTGKIAKMEALLRWNSPQLGMVAPYIFIPLAEENGSIIPIGEWVLKTACAQNKAWQNLGLPDIKISVNLSVRQFQQPNLVSIVAQILQETQLSPSALELEITESVTMQDTELAQTILSKFASMGVCLSMDDFGTGYSSLSYLKQFPFHTLKIDRSFVKDLHSNSQDMAIVQAVITLGKGLNLNVVAEGVETTELQNILQNLGCEYIQGYLYSKPVPAAIATELLKQNKF